MDFSLDEMRMVTRFFFFFFFKRITQWSFFLSIFEVIKFTPNLYILIGAICLKESQRSIQD